MEVTNILGDVRGTDWNRHAVASAVACRHGDAARTDTTRVGGRVARPDGIPACNNNDGEYGGWARKTGSSLADHTGDHQEHADFLASAHPRALRLGSRSARPAQMEDLPSAHTRPPPGTVGMAWRLVREPGDPCDVGDSVGFVPVVVVGRVHWDGRIAYPFGEDTMPALLATWDRGAGQRRPRPAPARGSAVTKAILVEHERSNTDLAGPGVGQVARAIWRHDFAAQSAHVEQGRRRRSRLEEVNRIGSHGPVGLLRPRRRAGKDREPCASRTVRHGLRRRLPTVREPSAENFGTGFGVVRQPLQNVTQISENIYPVPLTAGGHTEQRRRRPRPRALPANSQFLRPMAMCRSVNSAMLLSMSRKPSLR